MKEDARDPSYFNNHQRVVLKRLFDYWVENWVAIGSIKNLQAERNK